jgi:hypothetical protein
VPQEHAHEAPRCRLGGGSEQYFGAEAGPTIGVRQWSDGALQDQPLDQLGVARRHRYRGGPPPEVPITAATLVMPRCAHSVRVTSANPVTVVPVDSGVRP